MFQKCAQKVEFRSDDSVNQKSILQMEG